MPKAWYILHSYAGMESKVQENIMRRVEAHHFEERVSQVLVPKEKRHEFQKGRRVEVEKIIFPSYVFVEMELDEETWSVVRHTPGVIGFVNINGHPVPMTEKEVEGVRNRVEEGMVPKFSLEVNQKVEVASGPFEGLKGIINAIYPDKDKARLTVGFFGRDVVVEVDTAQLKKI